MHTQRGGGQWVSMQLNYANKTGTLHAVTNAAAGLQACMNLIPLYLQQALIVQRHLHT